MALEVVNPSQGVKLEQRRDNPAWILDVCDLGWRNVVTQAFSWKRTGRDEFTSSYY